MGRNRNSREPQVTMELEADRLRRIIQDSDALELTKCADKLGESLVKAGLTTAQIRNIFGIARRLKTSWKHPDKSTPQEHKKSRRDLVLLKPKLAYQASRKPSVETLRVWITEAINLVVSASNEAEEYQYFTNFFDFFEATLAYHKYYGGRDN